MLDRRVLSRLGQSHGTTGEGRHRHRWLPAVAVAALAAVAFAAVWTGMHRAPVDDTVGDVARVGVVDGQQVSSYLAGSRNELASLDGQSRAPLYALVSFGSYVEPAVAQSLLADLPTSRVVSRVPLAGVQTEIVTLPVDTFAADVPAGMRRTASRKEADAREADRLARGLTGSGDREQRLRDFYVHDAAALRAEAASYRRLCACLYAAVVRATPERLRELAGRPGIRAVDPAPQVRRLDRAVFVPLLPEQTTVVTPPADEGLTSAPSPSSTRGAR